MDACVRGGEGLTPGKIFKRHEVSNPMNQNSFGPIFGREAVRKRVKDLENQDLPYLGTRVRVPHAKAMGKDGKPNPPTPSDLLSTTAGGDEEGGDA